MELAHAVHDLAAACINIGYSLDPTGLPTEAVTKSQLFLNWFAWGSVIASLAIAVLGIGWSRVSEKIGHAGGAAAGKTAFYVALGKVAGIALLPAALIWVYGMLSGIKLGC
jgi:hypothetical protein